MNRKGIALVLALATVLVVSGIGTLLFVRTLGEIRHSGQDQAIVQTLMLARGGANAGGALLSTRVRQDLEALLQTTASITDCWAYGGNVNCVAPLPDPNLVALALSNLASLLQLRVDLRFCNQTFNPSLAGAEVRVRVHFTPIACGQGLPPETRLPPGRFVEGIARTGLGTASSQTYALPFVMVAEARLGPHRRNVVLQGEYRFTVGRSSFARYALFTNVHTLPNGTDVWFTDRTLFDGPVHTNSHFRFYRRPWFGGEVTSAGCTNPGDQSCRGQTNPGAYFYGVGFVTAGATRPSPSAPSYTNQFGTHAPEFTAGVDWNAGFIPLPPNAQDQRQAAQNAGLYFSRDITSLKLYRKCVSVVNGVEVACSEPLPLGVVKYQYIEVTYCTNANCNQTRTEVYRYGEDRLLQRQSGNTFVVVQRNGSPVVFNGVIYTDGQVRSFSGPARSRSNDPSTAGPALAEFAQITVAAQGTIRITGDLKYEKPPCTGVPVRNPNGTVTPATCDNLSARNVLGVYSQGGDVLISTTLRDLNLHATLMSSSGVVGVENYNTIPESGQVYLIGGIIEKYYGAFGTFNASTGQNSTGYGRAFTYDRRFLQGLAPPFFPTTGQDRIQSVSLFSYGQREQVY
ncbi:DUF4900 domain-containing protein [Thermus filiformis]|uniref:DUF4900 domain-containing protein n=1 Tax=Thermus filiformis TaxID=276 RepID=A0A0A2WT36_THEFI|nr:DUF4900 domain-containing protein [Thermus filiformis]KGQ22988.1 hypothetical protein THFILI_09695 [Thermus filiformis]